MSALSALATGRETSLFTADIAARETHLSDAIEGKRVLAIGAAGSIGSHTIFEIASRNAAALHIVDHNENALAELVRQLRSQPTPISVGELQTLPLDYGAMSMRRFLASHPPYDLVLNFAALKHVRTEKDPFSTLQMFETNLLKLANLLRWLHEQDFRGRLFTVSTDKAANPTSMMGASKRMMEHVLFNSSAAQALDCIKVSARFANVAFSNGSLLQSFENRLARSEPLAAPQSTERYFVSLEESGQICAIAAAAGPDRSILIPRLDPQVHLVELVDIAKKFLRRHGYEPALYENEQAACAAVSKERARNHWPLLLTPLDTAGEKPYEEFFTQDEEVFEIGLPNLRAIRYLSADRSAIDRALQLLEDSLSSDQPLDKAALKEIIGSVEPAFLASHRESVRNLDQRL